ncbi:MAG: hypothetical protein HGA47_12395 [Zoogloea sp.]|nr:hypothetical protein [Zoogloea sp.]
MPSISFRSPSAQELGQCFLTHLQDEIQLEGIYEDPDLKLQANSAEIGPAMLDQVSAMLARITWDRAVVSDFLGCYLTEPKPHVFFDHPEEALEPEDFAAACANGYRLDARTLLLFCGDAFFLNGERVEIPVADQAAVRSLADRRQLESLAGISAEGQELLHEWYCCGFAHAA